MADRNESLALGVALKEADRGATKSGGDAEVDEVLKYAKRDISSPSLKAAWIDAAEFSPRRGHEIPRDVYERAQRKMANALGINQVVDGHVVGHALMCAAEGGYLNVVRRLRRGQVELRCSVLGPRFLAFAFVKAAEVGQVEVVEELLRTVNSSVLAMVGYELATKVQKDQYPFVTVNLTKDWEKKLSGLTSFLPTATYVVQRENLELQGAGSNQEMVHEAVRSCYQLYCVWRLMLVAGANGHGGVFREFLMKREDYSARASESRKALMGYEHPKVVELNKVRTRIDDEFMRLVTKVLAKLSRDQLLYEVYRSREGNSVQDTKNGGNAWRCSSKAQFGLWEVLMEVPVLLMELEGSYQDNDKRQLLRKYRYIKPIIPQMMKLNVQFKIVIEIAPNYIELAVGINHVRVTLDNQCWEEKQTGHFPTRVSLSVTPVAQTLTSVSMTGGSSNTQFKVGVSENLRVGVNLGIKAGLSAAATAGVNVQAGKGTTSKIEGKPWRMEQLPVYNERGGSYTWILSNLHGAGFDRMNPMLQEAKTSIWQFGRRVPVNPLMVLPFGTNGGVNFTGSEFDDTIAWRFTKDMENQNVQFHIEGQVHTTHITQDRFWETRVVPFEVMLEQKLEACGDPSGGDKKKKKKKK